MSKLELEDRPLGELSVLNVGAGDLKLSFDPTDPEKVKQAKRVVQDMLKRGYVILIEHEGETRKVKKFDPKTCEYIISDLPEEKHTKPKIKGSPKKVAASKTTATAVAPTGGG